jgi:NADH pyrophosphatase NudC (nudix superfamily)
MVLKIKNKYCIYGEFIMKKQNCPFCGHRWVRSSDEIKIVCPNCKKSFTEEEYLEMKALYEED